MADEKLTRTDAEVKLLEKRIAELEGERDQALADREQEGMIEEDARQGTIVDRLARVSERLHYIERKGQMRSSGANFTYASIDQLRAAVRPALAAEGIVMVPHKVEPVRQEERTKGERVQFDTILRVTWRFACSYRPEPEGPGSRVVLGSQALEYLSWIDVPALGRSLNSSDKDINTAMTYAERNALLAVFHLESGDDPEQDRPEAEPQQRTAPRGSSAPRDHGPGGPPPSGRALPPTDEQRGEAARIRLALAPIVGGEDRVNSWVASLVAGEFPDTPMRDLNRDQFEVLLDGLREQLTKLAATEAGAHLAGWNPKTGEVAAAAPEKPQEAPTAPETTEGPAEGPEAPPAPAQDQGEPVPPASEAAQAAIEQQAAEAGLGEPPTSNPDNPPGAGYEQARDAVLAAGLDEGAFLSLMMEVGAAQPSDMDDPTTARLFQDALAKRLEG